MNIYFTDFFGVDEDVLEEYGAFNVSLVTDLPLFIDPFLLFESKKPLYRELHDEMIRYLRFLRDKSDQGMQHPGLIKAWYRFPEIKQNWLGFCTIGNSGRGLGQKFALGLNRNLGVIFQDFGKEAVTKGSHIEKVCLMGDGIGRDMVSDFTTNLIMGYLLGYTEHFARDHIAPSRRREFCVERAHFDYARERWMPGRFVLPCHCGDYVILTPKDLLTKDDTWISRRDMLDRFFDIPNAIEDEQLRAEISNYLHKALAARERGHEVTDEDRERAIMAALKDYPVLIDYYIKRKEDTGTDALRRSADNVGESTLLYIQQFGEMPVLLQRHTGFYTIPGNTREETRQKLEFFKDVIENRGGHKILYLNGKPVRREGDVHILFALCWLGSPSDVSREANDGRGPADFKISRGAFDKTLVEFKLASNSHLRRNLLKQTGVYEKASGAQHAFKVIVYFTEAEFESVRETLANLGLHRDDSVILIDARDDNKPSGSKA